MSKEKLFAEAIQMLEGNGFAVIKLPKCKNDSPHGKHSLKTKTYMCDGKEPIPHGYNSGYFGSFGWRVNCLCGDSFPDYPIADGEKSAWKKHQKEHGLVSIPPLCPKCDHAWQKHNRKIGCHSLTSLVNGTNVPCGCMVDVRDVEHGKVS